MSAVPIVNDMPSVEAGTGLFQYVLIVSVLMAFGLRTACTVDYVSVSLYTIIGFRSVVVLMSFCVDVRCNVYTFAINVALAHSKRACLSSQRSNEKAHNGAVLLLPYLVQHLGLALMAPDTLKLQKSIPLQRDESERPDHAASARQM